MVLVGYHLILDKTSIRASSSYACFYPKFGLYPPGDKEIILIFALYLVFFLFNHENAVNYQKMSLVMENIVK